MKKEMKILFYKNDLAAMKPNYFKSHSLLIDLILFFLTFGLGLMFGRIILGAITKELVIESLSLAVLLEIIFRFGFKKRKSVD